MAQHFEYKFVRLEQDSWGMGPSKAAMEGYQTIVHEHAAGGWRLVQIFAPGVGGFGYAKYYELIFERPVTEIPT